MTKQKNIKQWTHFSTDQSFNPMGNPYAQIRFAHTNAQVGALFCAFRQVLPN
jgi:hypothetical protein